MISYKRAVADGKTIFYREGGPANAPTILLLHGFPTSSHMFRNLIPALADSYYVVAPDLPGFGFSDSPDRKSFPYTFENLAKVIDTFTRAIGLQRFAMYIFDYGAPVGLRIALAHPDRIMAIISQNGNAYEEGLSDGWNPIQKYWKEPTPQNRAVLRDFLKPDATKRQYVHGVRDESQIAPESYTLDSALLARPGNDEIQLDLFLDYASNVALYPKFQEYFRSKRPPLLAVWGKNDPFFLPPGAEAFKRDMANAEVHFYDTGHFALKSAGQKQTAKRAVQRGKRRLSSSPSRKKFQARAGAQSGDLQGLSTRERADSESVDELLEEGNVFEAGVVKGVEEAEDADEKEVHSHEVPEDDVPGEYLDKDN